MNATWTGRLLLMLLLGVATTFSAQAQQGSDRESSLRRDIRENRSRISTIKQKLEEANAREKDLAVKLADTRARKQKAEEELALVEERLSEAKELLRQIKVRVQRTSVRLLRSQKALEKRLRAVYMQGEVSYLAVLLQSDDFTDFLNHADFLQRILQSDSDLIATVKAHREDLDEQRKAARATVIELARLQAQKRDAVDSLARLKAAQDDLHARLQAHKKALSSRIDDIEHSNVKKERELQAMIRARSQPVRPVPRSAGGYIYPVNGPITSNYGYRIHPIHGTTRFHSGVDFGVGHGVPIVAAENGIVIHSGWYGGYGNTVVVDHGGGYTTLYAHASRLSVSQGQQVGRGQTIAYVGSTGMSTGPHLHFEVRYHGDPIDPFSRL